MLDVLTSEHIRMARATGLSPRSIYLRHALKNAALKILTIVGLLTVGLLGGTLFAENIFALPGLGSLLGTATTTHDFPVVEALAVLFTLMVVGINSSLTSLTVGSTREYALLVDGVFKRVPTRVA